jgi:UDP-N-acetylmuramate--alanine ligase
MLFQQVKHIHLVGIGGVGMSGIAEILLNLGYYVTGSDICYSKTTGYLQRLGAKIFIPHSSANIKGADVVVYSSAVPEDNCELQAARKSKIPIIKRAEMLSEFMRLRYSIAVAGSHGKTTTTSLITHILSAADLDPTYVIGGRYLQTSGYAKLGSSQYLVCETDESDGSFLDLYPSLAVITNIDEEHLSYYSDDFNSLASAFLKFAHKVPFWGRVILNVDCPTIFSLLDKFRRRILLYGLLTPGEHKSEDVISQLIESGYVSAKDITYTHLESQFTLLYNNQELTRIKLNLPGKHNISNALGAAAVALELGIKEDIIKEALSNFPGVSRRLEIKAKFDNLWIIDDYAHHPTEIEVTLNTLRHIIPEFRIIAVFQPHRYSRTQQLWQKFALSFKEADCIILLPIYAASESPIEGVNSRLIASAINQFYPSKEVHLATSKEEAAAIAKIHLREKEAVITLGAGDVWQVSEYLLNMKKQDSFLIKDKDLSEI